MPSYSLSGVLSGSYSFHADVSIHAPTSGFSFKLGLTTGTNVEDSGILLTEGFLPILTESGGAIEIEGGNTGSFSVFTESVAFSGYSGYIFDQERDLIGGYQSGDIISFSGVVFDESELRMSYYLNDKLIKNNLELSWPFIDTIIFDNGGSGSMNFNVVERFDSEDDQVVYLQSSDGYLLMTSS